MTTQPLARTVAELGEQKAESERVAAAQRGHRRRRGNSRASGRRSGTAFFSRPPSHFHL